MTARPLGLATCPVLAPALDRPFRDLLGTKVKLNEKKMAATGASTLDLVTYLLKMALSRQNFAERKE